MLNGIKTKQEGFTDLETVNVHIKCTYRFYRTPDTGLGFLTQVQVEDI